MKNTHTQLNLTKSKKQVTLDRISLINQGLLADSSYHLDLLIEKIKRHEPVRCTENLYIMEDK